MSAVLAHIVTPSITVMIVDQAAIVIYAPMALSMHITARRSQFLEALKMRQGAWEYTEAFTRTQ